MDEELSAPAPARSTPQAAPKASLCKGCGAPLAADARVCMLCGYDTQTGMVRTKKTEARPGRQTGLGATVSLLRGTALSFVFARVDAIIWAVVAWLTQREFGFIAWGLGGLAGFGMALGHEDDDGTTAGIVAAFMSLLGIIMAKILIIITWSPPSSWPWPIRPPTRGLSIKTRSNGRCCRRAWPERNSRNKASTPGRQPKNSGSKRPPPRGSKSTS
jgi:hypothetical protein